MQAPFPILSDILQKAILTAYPQLKELPESFQVELVQSTQDRFGHYQCNSAMKLTKLLQAPPRQIAETIVKHLDPMHQGKQIIAKIEIAGPGFINLTLDPAYLSAATLTTLQDRHLGIPLPSKKERIVIDFSSPNIAKEMHVGHLRSTIIGDSLARLFEFLGHDVMRLNHLGDWGTSFGMLIAYIKEEAPGVLTGTQETDLPHLMAWYKASKKKFDDDAEFKRRAQQEVVGLQSGNAYSLKAWKLICDISERAYSEIYDLLDVHIISRGESFYNPMLADLVADLTAKGLIQISDGAKCLFLEGFKNREGEPLPLMLQKSDGGYNYDTTDLTAIRHRIEDEKADRIIYVIDAGQSLHMQMIFKAAEKAGYLDPKRVRVDHVAFGLVLGPDGKKFKTRAGDSEKLIDLLRRAIDEAHRILLEKNPKMDPKECADLARALGIGAVKYADLSSNRTGDYMFSYERMLRFEGNTAAFLMYAYVRVAGIKRKVKVDVATLLHEKIMLEHPSEIALGLQVVQFNETLDQIVNELTPHRLTDYLYTLAEKFNAFFRDCRVEGTAQQTSRLLLCEAVARTLKQGLEILGLRVVDRM